MGEEPHRVRSEDPSPEDLRRLEREIERSRERLSGLVAELDRRRHELLSVRAHPVRTGALGAATAGLIAGGVFLILRRRARRQQARVKGRQFGQALGRVFEHPERLASKAKRPVSRVLVAVAPILIRKITDRAFAARRRR
jgi:hypothetical protein